MPKRLTVHLKPSFPVKDAGPQKGQRLGKLANLSHTVTEATDVNQETKPRDGSRHMDLEKEVKSSLLPHSRSIHQVSAHLVRSRRDSQTPQQLRRQGVVRVAS